MTKTLCAALLLAAGSARAAGILIDTQDSRASGMSTAIVAHVEDSAAIYYNPAGLLGIPRLDIKVGDTGIIPRVTFTPAPGTPGAGNTYGQEFSVSPPPHGYVGYRLLDKLALGVGVSVPYASRSNWEDDDPDNRFVGRFNGRISRFAAWHIAAAAAYQVHERVRLGLGANLVRGTVEIDRAVSVDPARFPEGDITLAGGAWGWGLNAGLQVDVLPKLLKLGVTYRNQVSLDFDGDADFDVAPELTGTLRDQVVGADLRLPTMWGAGLAFTPLERLTLAFDVNWVRWSDIPQLFIDFGDDRVVSGIDNPLPKNWDDTFNYHLGAEYRFTPAFAGRLGFMVDPTPSPPETLGPDLPDADRIKVSGGIGWQLSWLRLDAAYQYLFLLDTESTLPRVGTTPPLPGTYGGAAHVLSLTLGFRQ